MGIQESQGVCHRNAVISSQTGPLRVNFVPPDAYPKPLFCHVHVTIRLFHRHHVHMPLQNHRWLLLVAGSGLFYDNDIFQFILNAEKPSLLRKTSQIIADLSHISRTMGNACNLLKKMKYALRLQSF